MQKHQVRVLTLLVAFLDGKHIDPPPRVICQCSEYVLGMTLSYYHTKYR